MVFEDGLGPEWWMLTYVNQQFLGKKWFNHEKSIENGIHQAFLGDFWGD
jgi:hypothetical protein